MKYIVGSEKVQKCGLTATIVEIYDNGYVKVLLSSGDERVVSKSYFRSGNMRVESKVGGKSKYNIGDVKWQCKCGMSAELIWISEDRATCDVRFDNGEVRCGVRLNTFVKGNIPDIGFKRCIVGEKVYQSNMGMYAKIIELLPDRKCKVEFDNGSIEVVSRKIFRGGKISISNRDFSSIEIGTVIPQRGGLSAKYLGHEGGKVIVELSNGEIRSVAKKSFLNGKLSKKLQSLVGCDFINSLGMRYVVIERIAIDIGNAKYVVRWEDNSENIVNSVGLKNNPMPTEFIRTSRNVLYNEDKSKVLSVYFDKSIEKYRFVTEDNSKSRKILVLNH